MADLRKAQDEAIALIDTGKAMIDKVLTIKEMFFDVPTLSVAYTDNPMEFLLKLLRELGVTDEKLKDTFYYILLGALPALEIGIKGVLLTNLKNMVSCSVDPRIPEQYRKYTVGGNTQDPQRRGIDIDLSSIDMFSKLSVSPLSKAGTEYYFGLEGVGSSYQFARADDMDAFLWFVKNKGKFPNSTLITDTADLKTKTGANTVSDGNLLTELTLGFEDGNPSKVLEGNTFRYSGENTRVTSMCVESYRNDKLNITKNTLVPVSDDLTSANWYIRRADQLAKNIGIGWNSKKAKSATKSGRDYSKERAICNLQFLESLPESDLAGLIDNKFRFTILPKPYIHIPDIAHGEPPWRFKKILFNAKGELDSNGKLTLGGIPTETYDEATKSIIIKGTGYELQLNIKSGKVMVNTPTKSDDMVKYLVECYPGLTVYEFNYDYVMGMKLFDAKVIATQLLNTLMDVKLGISASISFSQQEAADEIRNIVRDIISQDGSTEINDCFFSFDNTKYTALMRAAEIKRANSHNNNPSIQKDIDEIYDILSEYDSNATLNEQKDVIDRAITKTSVIITEGVDESDKVTVQFNFVTDLIENLVQAIVYSLFTPKVLMLLEVNETLMGGKWKKFDVKDLLMAMRSIIVAIVNEIRDLILQELQKLAMELLKPIIEFLTSAIAREQIENYVDTINQLIRDCPFIWFKFGNELLNTTLDTVDYADIDLSEIKPGDKPNNTC